MKKPGDITVVTFSLTLVYNMDVMNRLGVFLFANNRWLLT